MRPGNHSDSVKRDGRTGNGLPAVRVIVNLVSGPGEPIGEFRRSAFDAAPEAIFYVCYPYSHRVLHIPNTIALQEIVTGWQAEG